MKLFGGFFKKSKPSLAFYPMPMAQGLPRNYESFSKEAYQKCVIAYRCIKLISTNCAKIPIILYKKNRDGSTEEIQEHPLLELLKHPNPVDSYESFVEGVFGYYLISGNVFIRSIGPNPQRPPMELWLLRPDKMKVVPGPMSMPSMFIYGFGKDELRYPVDVLGRSEILHIKSFNPLDEYFGQSPVEPSALSVDIQNTSNKWNLSLLLNEARPSGVIKIQHDAHASGRMTKDQQTELQKKLEQRWAGADNAGTPIILQGGMEWQQTSLSPKDMDHYLNNKVSKNDVAMGFGVPSQLVGVEGSLTFSNYEQAMMSLYDETILPLKRMYLGRLNRTIVPFYGEDLYLGYNEDNIVALELRRNQRRSALVQCTWLTTNEKREIEGWGKYEEGDEPGDKLLVSSGLMPLSMAADGGYTEELNDVSGDDVPDYEDDDDDRDNDKDKMIQKEGWSDDTHGLAFKPGTSLKVFKLRTQKEKLLYARMFMAKQKGYERLIKRQLINIFKDEEKKILKVVQNTNKEVWELGIVNVLSSSSQWMEKSLGSILSVAAMDFAMDVFSSGKAYSPKEFKDDGALLRAEIDKVAKRRAKESAEQVTRTTKKILMKRIKRAVEEEVLEGISLSVSAPELVRNIYKQGIQTRSLVVSRTTVHTACMESSLEAAEMLEIPGLQKEWISTHDDRTRTEMPERAHWSDHVVMDGVKVDLKEYFEVPSIDGIDLMNAPGDTTAPKDQFINCRCVMAYDD